MNEQKDYSWVLVLLIVGYVFLTNNNLVGGGSSPTKTLPSVPSVFTLFDDTPEAVLALETGHKGQYDVLQSNADDSIQKWVLVDQKGIYLKYGTKEPVPDEKNAGTWAIEAYNVAKTAGKVPWTVAAGPNGKGFSGPTPDGQEAAKALKVIGK